MNLHLSIFVRSLSPYSLAALVALTCLWVSLPVEAQGPRDPDATVILMYVDFETPGSGYTTSNLGDDGGWDYFIRTNDVTRPNTGNPQSVNYSAATGYFIAASDNDEYGEGTITTAVVDISSYQNLEISIGLAGDASHGDYEDENLYLEYSTDGGGWTTAMRYSGDVYGGSGDLREDTDLNGVGDGAQITPQFSTFTYQIPVTGSTLQARMRVMLGPSEDFAFDDLTIRGTPNVTITLDDGSSFLPVVAPGLTDQAIGRFGLTGNMTGAALSAAAIRLDGVRSGMSDIKLWSSSDSVFNAGDSQLGSAVASDPGDGGTVVFSGFSDAIGTSTRHFFLTTDVAFGSTGEVLAIIGHTSALTISDGFISPIATEIPLSTVAASLPVRLTSFTIE